MVGVAHDDFEVAPLKVDDFEVAHDDFGPLYVGDFDPVKLDAPSPMPPKRLG